MKTFVQPGDAVSVTAPADVLSGAGVLVGLLFGAALRDALSGAQVDIQVTGVVTLPKATGAISEGVRVFWDNTAKNVTTTTTSNNCIGYAVGGAYASDATTINVLLGKPNAAAA